MDNIGGYFGSFVCGMFIAFWIAISAKSDSVDSCEAKNLELHQLIAELINK